MNSEMLRLIRFRAVMSEAVTEWGKVADVSTHAMTKKYYRYFSQELGKHIERANKLISKIEWIETK